MQHKICNDAYYLNKGSIKVLILVTILDQWQTAEEGKSAETREKKQCDTSVSRRWSYIALS